ncbi:MAG TPA: GIY-YIG nuclease family protein [Negativicutes bacterium]|nr:GIY-YIG nuclease family protein [Negativicutes bacterium]
MAAYVYMVECADGTYYTGWTNDVANRIAAHNAGTGARYTRSRGPVRLVYQEEFEDKQAAQRREWAIKKLTRTQKTQMIGEFAGDPTGDDTGGMKVCTEVRQNQEA